jgi:hypothetical protein
MLVAILALMAFQSCKKGENDPAISFRSRDARITAKWKLTKIESAETDVSGNYTVSVTITYDGLNYTRVTAITGNPTDSLVAAGTYFMTIEKNGAMSWEETYTEYGTNIFRSGTASWYWVDSGKNKSAAHIGAGNLFIEGGTWSIDRLATKELRLRRSENTILNDYSYSREGIWYFEKD